MRDPYDVLGIKRGASFDEVKAAYRKACKSKHPDMGGSHEDMVELNTAYAFILDELKSGYQQQQREEAPRQDQTHGQAGRAEAKSDRRWEKTYRDIDDELEELRRAAQAHEDALRAMRSRAWEAGEHAAWAKLTWEDFSRFIRGIARSGVKGLSLLFAALIGIGSVLVEANVASAIIILASGIGLVFSLALRNEKSGLMSAFLLLFGIMTIWLPPVRAALFLHPLATISVLICLGLIFKFAQQGGTVGLMTGGVLALYVIGVIVADTQRQQQQAAVRPQSRPAQQEPVAPAAPSKPNLPNSQQAPSASVTPPRPQPAPPPPPPEARTLLASNGAVLKFVSGVTYHLKVRTGFTTSLAASQGQVAFYSGDQKVGECVGRLELPMHASTTPYEEINRTIRACGTDAAVRVVDVW